MSQLLLEPPGGLPRKLKAGVVYMHQGDCLDPAYLREVAARGGVMSAQQREVYDEMLRSYLHPLLWVHRDRGGL